MEKKFNFAVAPSGGNGQIPLDTNYLDQVRDELMGRICLTGRTLDWAFVIPDVANRMTLNSFTVGKAVLDTCGWPEEPDTMTLYQRELVLAQRAIKDTICGKDIKKTFLGMFMRSEREMPFIGVVAEQYVDAAKADIESWIWKGDYDFSTMSEVNYNGLFPIAMADRTYSLNKSLSVGAGTTLIEQSSAFIADAASQMPELFERNDIVFCLPMSDFVALANELTINGNLFHYTTEVDGSMHFVYPGTNVTVRGIAGMNGVVAPATGAKKPWIITYAENVCVGTSFNGSVGENEDFKIWYSNDNDELRARVIYGIGANFRDPNMVGVGF